MQTPQEKVVKKINNLRSAYRKEMKKVIASKRTGAGEDEVYIPNLWYYEYLTFLADQEVPRSSCSNVDTPLEDSEDISEVSVKQLFVNNKKYRSVSMYFIYKIPCQKLQVQSNHDLAVVRKTLPTLHLPKQPKHDKEKRLDIRRVKQVDTTYDLLAIVSNKLQNNKEDDQFDCIGKTVAVKLRMLPNDQRIFAEKLINDVLFEAELSALNRTTKVVANNNIQENVGYPSNNQNHTNGNWGEHQNYNNTLVGYITNFNTEKY
ncbi:uncharacterized protein [Onthophagus taurus]|uniref:uncharacterized protein n=1 Tax=Onthophagus taurus TaxID=166361 RepID=UPI0039BE946B